MRANCGLQCRSELAGRLGEARKRASPSEAIRTRRGASWWSAHPSRLLAGSTIAIAGLLEA